jgi:hypothetical protein
MPVILSSKAWPDSSTLEVLASIIASHLYKVSRLARTMSTASVPSVGGIPEQIGLPYLPAVLLISTGATIMKLGFMRDVGCHWSDIALASIPS